MNGLRDWPRVLFILAAVLALAASALILFSTSEGSETVIDPELGNYEVPYRVSWYESQGWWGVVVVLAYAALYYAPLHFYRRERPGAAAVFGAVTLALTVLAGFSIGLVYFPAALALLLGLVVMGVRRLGPGQEPT
ncbi:MAG: hypothetical protein DWG76_00375 [Chloroflexi bacterium]|nr:hypothetical protein [Chloroflexota bacterium]